MAVKTIPQTFEHECDACGKSQMSDRGDPHYLLPHWSQFELRQYAYDAGTATADASIKLLLCDECTVRANDMAKALSDKGKR